jgi:8-oxo-dGTP pyrophosphatase MutT (NUDIX family)
VDTTPVDEAVAKGRVAGNGSTAMAVAQGGSNNMIAFRYKLRNVAMRVADTSFKAEGIEFPAGSFVITGATDMAAVRAAVEEFGLTAAALPSAPSVATHDADVPRVAIYSSWDRSTQETGWVRFTFDKFGIPFDLIYKERVREGNLRNDYDVIVMPTQNLTRASVFAPPAARPVSYTKNDKYKFLGMYGETDDMTGGMGAEGVEAFQRFLDAGGTLVTMGNATRFPTELGMGRSVDASGSTTSNFYAPRPIVEAEVLRLDHPVFYGYVDKVMPIKYLAGPLMTVGAPDRDNVLARYVGGEDAVLSGLMRGADEVRDRPFAVDIPGGYSGKGRVVMFANNPIYRWQNHGEFNLVFNTIVNWNDLASAGATAKPTTNAAR